MKLTVNNKNCELKPFDFRAMDTAWKFMRQLEDKLELELEMEYIPSELEGTKARFAECRVKVPQFNLSYDLVLNFCFQTTSKTRPLAWGKDGPTRRQVFQNEFKRIAAGVRWELYRAQDLYKRMCKIEGVPA